MAVSFHQLSSITLQHRKALKVFIDTIFVSENRQLDFLDIIFCSDDYLLKINQTHLQHDYYTDIITFDLSSTKKSPIVAELYISIDRVRDNATINKQKVTKELHRVIFHGVLHLCGYKDKTKADIITMRRMEEKYLRLYFK